MRGVARLHGVMHGDDLVPGILAQNAVGGKAELALEAAYGVGHIVSVRAVHGLRVDAGVDACNFVQTALHVAHILAAVARAQGNAGIGVGAAADGGVIVPDQGVPGGPSDPPNSTYDLAGSNGPFWVG